MLLFITQQAEDTEQADKFQYIPCYCLSKYPPLSVTLQHHFNTSHVTVYQQKVLEMQQIFSYFNTSHVTVYPIKCPRCGANNEFQYIPCYCLSGRTARGDAIKGISIHPMLLFIFYRTPLFIKLSCISIHPMLLFILDVLCNKESFRRFQYIPCYCLSACRSAGGGISLKFQYIPCYCLS